MKRPAQFVQSGSPSERPKLTGQADADHVAAGVTPIANQPPAGVSARMEWRKVDVRRKQELDLMKELRLIRDAPVDNLFTPGIADQAVSPSVKAFHVFVAVFLSSQTRDEVTAQAMQRLKQLPGGLNIDSVIKARVTTLAKLMKPVAFHNTKAKNLKLIARSLASNHGKEVPLDAEILCQLPGIGPKMAHIVVSVLTGAPQGIGIDVHVHRISNKLGWVKTKEPEQTRVQLQKMLPYGEWKSVNIVMVGLGQQMHSAPAKIMQRSLSSSDPFATFKLLQKLDFDLETVDKSSGQGVLHWAASQGRPVNDTNTAWRRACLVMLLKHVTPVKDKSGQWPWDVARSDLVSVFDPWRNGSGVSGGA